jgi:predicted RNA binding protein YcfA (HicA-like mRNA interferase family)
MNGIETSQREIVARLSADGWELARHGARHDIYKHPNQPGKHIQVPLHRNLSIGVARAIAEEAGWL